MTFQQKLDKIVKKNKSLVCVGLDSDYEKIPKFLKGKKFPQFEFNKAIIKATADLVCAYKPNSAFYEARGEEGIADLKMTCDFLRKNYPEIPIILDAKRGDIGSSNDGYLKYAFDYLGADAITLHPYLGKEALMPFLARKDKGCIILCKTSNPGAGEFQNLIISQTSLPTWIDRSQVGQAKLYQLVAEKTAKEWNFNQNCFLVVGATYPEELKEVRKIVGEMTLLVPGIGAQGGDLEKTLKAGLNSKNKGLIINSSRAIIFASSGKDFAEKAREEAERLRKEINQYR